MNKASIITSLFCLFFLLKCNPKPESEFKYIDDYCRGYEEFDNNIKAVLIVPMDGCSGCLDRSVGFLKKNINDDNILFILVSSSRKSITVRLGGFQVNRSNLVLDVDSNAKTKGIVRVYPMICYVKNGVVVKTVELTGEIIEQGLLLLTNYLNNTENTPSSTIDYIDVDIKPEYPGGIQEFYKFLGDSLKYPVDALENKLDARVLIDFVINKDGTVSNIKVNEGKDDFNTDQMTKTLLNSPKWKPGYHNNKLVDTRLLVPIVLKYQ